MGTRGAYGFIKNGVEKITYNHFDSYPSYLGVEVCEFIEKNINDLDKIFYQLEMIYEAVEPTLEQSELCKSLGLWRDVSTGKDWYSHLRNAQGDLSWYAKGLTFMIEASSFLKDSLFCEWAYIINLDTSKLEIYRGFNKDPKAKGRYASLMRKDSREGFKYYGVSLIAEVPLIKCNSKTLNDEYDEVDDAYYFCINGERIEV
jgi:hypothetical protein